MAPEVALSQPYNHKAEVFSFTSLLYHVLSLEKPFASMDAKAFVAEACAAKGKPPLGVPLLPASRLAPFSRRATRAGAARWQRRGQPEALSTADSRRELGRCSG